MSDADECTNWFNTAPGSFCSSGAVSDLEIDNNTLDGRIPAEVALLSNSMRKFIGSCRMMNLTYRFCFVYPGRMSLEYNHLTGTILSEIGLLTTLGTYESDRVVFLDDTRFEFTLFYVVHP